MHHNADPLLAGETVAASMPYRNLASGRQNGQTYVFGMTVPLDTTRAVAAIVPPNGDGGRLNLFAAGLG